MKWKLAVLPAAVAAVALGGLTTPAHAAVPRIPFTCGMSVHTDAVVYLKRSVTCSTDVGIFVGREDYDDALPTVTIDLRGKTLRGTDRPGSRGVWTSDIPFGDTVNATVRNGVLRDWDTAVDGVYGTRAQRVTFRSNRIGVDCGGCTVDRSVFWDNDAGFYAPPDAGGRVTRSTFIDNRAGVLAESLGTAFVDSSLFVRNQVGVTSDWSVEVTHSGFLKNGTAVRVSKGLDWDFGDGGAYLAKVWFKANGSNLVGDRCTTPPFGIAKQ